MRSLLIAVLLIVIAGINAAEAPQITAFNKAMAGQDFQAKRAAIIGLNAVKDDKVVYGMLISALSDRQGKASAIKALQSRSGLRPSQSKGGNTGYPGYPTDNSAGAWSAWNRLRQEKVDAEAKLAEAEAKAKEAEEKAEEAKKIAEEGGENGDQPEDDSGENNDQTENGDETAAPKGLPPEVLGKLDRIFFKDGSILVGYITVRRRDMTGTLTSIHVVHKSGGGEEDVDAALISRIEDDIE